MSTWGGYTSSIGEEAEIKNEKLNLQILKKLKMVIK
jgi:hypothetical protein